MARSLRFHLVLLAIPLALGQPPAREDNPPPPPEAHAADPKDTRRTELNLAGKTDASSGESRRNENVQFNLIDNGALKELNIRVGSSATLLQEFKPDRGYFSSEFGVPPTGPIHLLASGKPRTGFHGLLRATHQNSAFTARAFFQAGGVKPARDNDYGFNFSLPQWRKIRLSLEAGQQKNRGFVNGNVLVPQPDERTPLTTDPATRAIVSRFLAAFPAELPNRTDINSRALNRNAPQSIDSDNARLRLDFQASQRDSIAAQYQLLFQHVDAFQLVAGQNPITDTKSHKVRLTWTRAWNANTVTELSTGFDRLRSLLTPENSAVGPLVIIAGLTTLGPDGTIPINRATNLFRQAGALRHNAGNHSLTAGFEVLRRQLNGREEDSHRGFFSFNFDFGRDAITNLRLGLPTQHILSIGDIHRGFRNWDLLFYVGDSWKATRNLTVHAGLRYQPVTTPNEVNGKNQIPYPCDCNNVAPSLGFAYRLPSSLGVLRANYGLHYGEIFPVTFQQIRFAPPLSVKFAVPAPPLANPLSSGLRGSPNFYVLDSNLRAPYEHQYNFLWEVELSRYWRLQTGYVGSRQHKLLVMWYLNRAHPVPGIPLITATINDRRAKPSEAETRYVVNGSRGYFDAARTTLQLLQWRGATMEASYWLSKSMDLGASYTNTAYDMDSRLSRSQSEFETHRDGKSLSSFDQPHAFLWRGGFDVPAGRVHWLRGWNISSVVLIKPGTPFIVQTGSDGPGFGNVDGNGGDRPNLLDPSILGRTIGHPDTSRQRLPRSAFSFIRLGDETGNLGRNTFRKGPIRNVNSSLNRTWRLAHPELRLTFTAESLNFFNTPQFAEPGFEVANPNFGQITNTLNDGRAFRFGLQIGW